MSRIKEKDGGKVSPKAKEKERKDMVKPLEHSVLCKQEEDLGSDEEEEKVKVVEKVEEQEKARKEEKARKAKEKVKAKERKAKENDLEELCVGFVIKKDIGELNAPTDTQLDMLRLKNRIKEEKCMLTAHRIRISIPDRMLSNLEVSDRLRVDRTQESLQGE